jgi:hypothetical protein
VSQILDRLKQAEQERERVIAERKRLEAEADAALAAHEREQLLQQEPRAVLPPPARPKEQTPQQQSRLAAAVAIAVAMAVVFWVGTLMPRNPANPPAEPAPKALVPAPRAAPALFKLDSDLEAFAARTQDKPVTDKR